MTDRALPGLVVVSALGRVTGAAEGPGRREEGNGRSGVAGGAGYVDVLRNGLWNGLLDGRFVGAPNVTVPVAGAAIPDGGVVLLVAGPTLPNSRPDRQADRRRMAVDALPVGMSGVGERDAPEARPLLGYHDWKGNLPDRRQLVRLMTRAAGTRLPRLMVTDITPPGSFESKPTVSAGGGVALDTGMPPMAAVRERVALLAAAGGRLVTEP